MRRSVGAALGGLGTLVLAAGSVQAAGFAIKEQSAGAQGTAFAGATAEAGDISYMFFNPAGLTRHDGHRASLGASLVMPRAEPSDMQGQRGRAGGGTAISGGNGGGDVAEDALVPNLYGMVSLSPDLKIGIGVNAPFGLRTEYDAGWTGRYHAIDSELQTLNVNPNVAYRVSDWLSLGVGVQFQRAEAELSNAVDFGAIAGPAPGAADGLATVEGDDIGIGATAGLLLEPSERTRFGLAYRSEVDHELTGEADFSGGGLVRRGLAATGRFADTSASAALTTPDQITAGAYHRLSDRWAVMGEVQWTQWSDFDQLVVEFDNNTPDSVTEEDWDDSWFAALGATYRPSETLELRGGVAYDQSPIPDETRTPRIPGGDRTWVSLGASWQPLAYLTVDASYTHIFVSDTSLELDAGDTGNRFRGDLTGDYENAIDLVSLQATLSF